jgi:lysophospholipase L1-like esterase
MGVVVVLPPDFGTEAHLADAGPRVRVVDLDQFPEMHDEALRLDGFHFSTGGHSQAADAVAPAVLGLIHDARPSR